MAPKKQPQPPPDSIDLTKYQTAELADRIAQLVSLPKRLTTIGTCGACCLLAVWIIVSVVFGPRVHWSVLAGLIAYGSLAALAIGLLLGLLIVLNRALDSVIDLFDLSLNVTEQAAGDVDDFREGKLNIDTGRLLHSVHDDVILPTVEKVIYGQSRWLGKLLFPLYRVSIGKITKRVLSFVGDEEPAPADTTPQELCDNEDSTPPEASQNALDRSRDFLRRAHDFVKRRGHQLRRTVIIPLTVLLALALALALLPLVVTLCIVVLR